MTILEPEAVACRTLATRLAEGAIPVKEILRYAALLGETLRTMHDAGKSHGSVSPETILLTAEGLELLPAATGGPIDIAGDIFAFGTVLGQMTRSARADAEDHGLGPLIAACLAKDPGSRPPNMQKALLELKLAGLSARHWGSRAAGRDESDAVLRAEIQSSEVRQETRIREHEVNIARKQQLIGEALSSMRGEIDGLDRKVAEVRLITEAATRQFTELERGVNAAIQQLGARLADAIRAVEQDIGTQTATLESVRGSMAHTDDLVGRIVETVEARLSAVHRSAAENASRIDVLEDAIKAADVENSSLYNQLAAGLRKAQTDIDVQTAAVASVRKSMAQTDDLVGRVVEAVENILDLGAARVGR